VDQNWFGIAAVFFLVLANGFFVATEFALVGVRRSRLDQLAAEGNNAAKSARNMVHHLDTYIAACQLGITMASLALGWIGEPAFAHLIEPPIEMLVGSFAPTASHAVAVGFSFALITALHIVIGELAPKGLALQKPESVSLWIAAPMKIFETVFRYPIRLLNGIGNAVLRVFGMEPASGHEMVHSVEELRMLVTGMEQAGVVDRVEARIASRAFQFGEITAAELMTPRTEVQGVPVTASISDAIDAALAVRHTRLVVYDKSLDDIVGTLHLRDLLRASQAGTKGSLRPWLRPAMIFPASNPVETLLEEMRHQGRQIAVVVDEFGGTAGIVTLEDLLKALVGHISDEGEPSPSLDEVSAGATGPMELDGLTRLEEFEEMTGRRLPAELHESVDTLGGAVMALLDRVPELGDEVEVGNWRLRVAELDGRRVARIAAAPIELAA
jgi:CBS domain containing-hemolysin-like protein